MWALHAHVRLAVCDLGYHLVDLNEDQIKEMLAGKEVYYYKTFSGWYSSPTRISRMHNVKLKLTVEISAHEI